MLFPRILVLLVSTALLAACGGDSPTAPSQSSAPYSQTDLVVGTGAEATAGRTATVSYAGWLYDPARPDSKGAQFDAGTFPMVIGGGGVIPGFDRGVTGMRVGGRRRVVIPPELAYGSAGNPPIPPNATLVFDIELVAVD